MGASWIPVVASAKGGPSVSGGLGALALHRVDLCPRGHANRAPGLMSEQQSRWFFFKSIFKL